MSGLLVLQALLTLGIFAQVNSQGHPHQKFHNKWFTVEPLPIPLLNVTAASNKTHLFVFGADPNNDTTVASTFIYNPKTNSWSEGSQRKRAGTWSASVSQIRKTGDKEYESVFLFGGNGYGVEQSKQGKVGDSCIAVNEFHTTGPTKPPTHDTSMLTCVQRPVAALIGEGDDSKVYVCGGSNPHTGEVSGECNKFIPKTEKWTPLDDGLPIPVDGAASCYLPSTNKMYVIGGLDSRGEDEGAVQVFDVDSESWDTHSSLPDIPFPRSHTGAAICEGDSVYVIGGIMNNNIARPTGHVDILDVKEGKWHMGPFMAKHRASYPALVGGMVFLAGGVGPDGHASDEVTMMPIPNMDLDRHQRTIMEQLRNAYPQHNKRNNAAAVEHHVEQLNAGHAAAAESVAKGFVSLDIDDDMPPGYVDLIQQPSKAKKGRSAGQKFGIAVLVIVILAAVGIGGFVGFRKFRRGTSLGADGQSKSIVAGVQKSDEITGLGSDQA